MSTLRSCLFLTVAVLALVASPEAVAAQASSLGAQSLRPYVHVFIAYALVWVIVGAWLFAIVRRLKRLERSLGD